MATRFRRTKKIAPGVRLNISKGSASVSIGPRGMKKTFSTTGRTTTTVGIPGTGLSSSSSSGARRQRVPSSERPTSPKNKTIALLLCIFLGMFGAHRYYVGKIGTGVLWTFTGGVVGIGWLVDLFTIIGGGFYDADGLALRWQPTQEETAAAEEAAAYMDADAVELWARWDSCHDQYPQQERMKRAAGGELTLDVFSPEAKCATFIGRNGGRYNTTLIGCTCPDFADRGLPCKHVYWLAQQLGLEHCEPSGGDEE